MTEIFKLLGVNSKWVFLGVLELIYNLVCIIMFVKYSFMFLTESFIVLDMVCTIVKVLTTLMFIMTFHMRVSSFSVPLIIAILTYGLLLPNLIYYTSLAIQENNISTIEAGTMLFKFLWYIYEALIAIYLTKYWKIKNEIDSKQKFRKRVTTRNSKQLRKFDLQIREKKPDKSQTNVRRSSLRPEIKDKEQRYIKNQEFIRACLIENAEQAQMHSKLTQCQLPKPSRIEPERKTVKMIQIYDAKTDSQISTKNKEFDVVVPVVKIEESTTSKSSIRFKEPEVGVPVKKSVTSTKVFIEKADSHESDDNTSGKVPSNIFF